MKISLIVSCFLACSVAAFAQQQSYFCSAGVVPDGFIDWTKLPKPPAANNGFGATIPVSGVTGLTVTISAAAGQGYAPYSYLVNSSALLQIGGGKQDVTLAFSKPIRGVRFMAQTSGRFGHSFDVQAIRTNGGVLGPQTYDVSSAASDPTPGETTTTSLQIVEDIADINSLVIHFSADTEEYNYFAIDDLRVDSGSQPDGSAAVPTAGLKQWLRADKGVNSDYIHGQSITSWVDQSPAGGGTASQSGENNSAYYISQSGQNCHPAISFTGKSVLTAQVPLAGSSGSTIFLVSRSDEDPFDGGSHSSHAALFWPENGSWGLTYLSPFQTHMAFRFGTGQPNNAPEIVRNGTVGADWTVTTASHNGGSDSLFVNGKLAGSVGGRQSTLANSTGEELIGQGAGNSFFHGQISEVLVYDRALSDSERQTVERYLITKYGAF